MWEEIFTANGFWFAIGIVVGLAIEFGGTFFFEWWRRPQLRVVQKEWRPVLSDATILLSGHSLNGKVAQVIAYRLRVTNDGRRAAENVAGTLEFGIIERRICWYEGNVPNITINAYDHSYLDVYGVILSPTGGTTGEIVMPTEGGWSNLAPRELTEPLKVRLRMTASNAKGDKADFYIDPAQNCKPVVTPEVVIAHRAMITETRKVEKAR